LFDAAFASLGNFLAGLYATRYLSPTALGAFALFYSVFILVNVAPTQLVLMPAEVASVAVEPRFRGAILGRSLRLGGLVAVLSSSSVPLVLLVPSDAEFGTRVALAVTTVVLTAASPLQDHARRMLHQSGRSWHAVEVSVTQTVLVLSFLAGLGFLGAPAPWVPFGALAAANVLSLAAAVWLVIRKVPRRSPTVPLDRRALVRSGGWLLAGSLLLFGAQAAAVAVLTSAAGSAAAGQAEAARVLAQPVSVLVMGLLSVYNPVLMAAAQNFDGRRVARVTGGFFALVGTATAFWFLFAGRSWSWSPLPHLVPRAYEVSGLLPWAIAVQACGYATLVFSTILLAGRREKMTTAAAAVQAVTLTSIVVVTAREHGPFALMWGGAAGTLGVYVFVPVALLLSSAPSGVGRIRPTPGGRPLTRPAAFEAVGAGNTGHTSLSAAESRRPGKEDQS
jgi:O-antigen/teichoic acid export membrane protein